MTLTQDEESPPRPLVIETWYDQSTRTAYIWFYGDLVSYDDLEFLQQTIIALRDRDARHVLYEMQDVNKWKPEAINAFSGWVTQIRNNGGIFGEIPSQRV